MPLNATLFGVVLYLNLLNEEMFKEIISCTEFSMILFLISLGSVLSSNNIATNPATTGVAIDVPERESTSSPELRAALTASSNILLAKVPNDKLANALTPLDLRSLTAHSMPCRIADKFPDPVRSKTLISTISTSLATPYVLEPNAPATWVPCPFLSPSPSSGTKLAPLLALPSKSGCPISIPVSRTYAVTPEPLDL
ncbi:hypothetical protein WICMUC_003642 [Wickerhamomyces mucosus]|uniref:Uncharacterized protein n=1 Tax=Wickerhamomyces mucosus TaxID=1378264 RepID=A0A9P8TCJ9_9ASCO|nr:hypothetical protein WICMUC_003642 [Wickerhamomyces mucosus]